MATDVTKSTLPQGKTFNDMAEDLLARYPGVDRAELLKKVTGWYFMEMRIGNKREERAACDFLNRLVYEANNLQMKKSEQTP